MSDEKPVEKCICQICQCGRHKCDHVDADFGIGDGIEENQTEYGKQFPAKQAPREKSFRSLHDNINNSGGDFDATTISRQDYGAKSVARNQPFKFVTSSNLDASGAEFYGNTTNKSDFQGRLASRQALAKPNQTTIANSGDFDGVTTMRNDYGLLANAPRNGIIKAPSDSQIFSGPFQSTTTNRADYEPKQADRNAPFRGANEAQIFSGPFQSTTTNRADYDKKEQVSRPQIVARYDSQIMPNSPFQAQSTNHSDFVQKQGERQSRHRPRSNNILSGNEKFSGQTIMQGDYQQKPHVRIVNVKPAAPEDTIHSPFDANTTYQDGFQPKNVEKPQVQRIKDEMSGIGNSGEFYGQSTQKIDFTEKHVDEICPAEKVLSRRDRSFEFKRNVNGHRFYEQKVTHGQYQPNRLVPVS